MLPTYESFLRERLGIKLRRYQRIVGRELEALLARGHPFIVVMMPTGSGKTLLEGLTASLLLRSQVSRVVVIEPTRLLVDQLYRKFWRPLYGGGGSIMEYEGRCGTFKGQWRVAVTTPRTAAKCLESSGGYGLIIDEVHRAYSNKYYAELIERIRPEYLVGFTALVPRERRLRLNPVFLELLGEPVYLAYDFKALAMLGEYESPPVIMDIYESELDEDSYELYQNLYYALLEGLDSRRSAFLARTLAKHGARAYCDSLKRLEERGLITGSLSEQLSRPCGALSHKVKALLDVAADYPLEELRPVIVFTSRVSTAVEASEELRRLKGLRVELMTGATSREERLSIIREASEGAVDVIVSSIVGEEGVDLPSAGLMVFLDTPRSSLRFYQRLGRLMRPSREHPVKYLVGVYTPGTGDYDDLRVAVENLALEGVDVSYIISNLEERGLLESLRRLVESRGEGPVSFPELASGNKLLREAAATILGDPEAIASKAPGSVADVMRLVERSRLYNELWRGLKEGVLAHYPDPERVGDLLYYHAAQRPWEGGVKKLYYPIVNYKPVYTYYTLITSPGSVRGILQGLEGALERYLQALSRLARLYSISCDGRVRLRAGRAGSLALRCRGDALIGEEWYRLEVSELRAYGFKPTHRCVGDIYYLSYTRGGAGEPFKGGVEGLEDSIIAPRECRRHARGFLDRVLLAGRAYRVAFTRALYLQILDLQD